MTRSAASVVQNKDVTARNVEEASVIFSEHEPFIRRAISAQAKGIEGDHETDLFQELFLSLVTSPPQNVRDMQGFLYRAIARDCIDERRKRQTYRLKRTEYARRRCDRAAPQPDERSILAEEVGQVFELMERALPQHLSVPIKLRYCKGLTNAEICKETGVNDGSVRR